MATTVQPSAGEPTKKLVNFRADGGVAIIEMNDPPANTYTYEMNRQLDDAILKARMDNSVYVIRLTGAGDKFFSAGANIKMLASVDPTFKYYFCLHANETLLRLEHTPKLVIAALNGHTVGGGLEVAMAADIRIAKKDAGKIGLPEVALGVLPGTGGTQRLARLIGKARAVEFMATGELMTFYDAQAIGPVAAAGPADVDAAVAAARAALNGPWGQMSARERGRLVSRLADRLIERIEEVSRLETLHNGKPITESLKIEVP